MAEELPPVSELGDPGRPLIPNVWPLAHSDMLRMAGHHAGMAWPCGACPNGGRKPWRLVVGGGTCSQRYAPHAHPKYHQRIAPT